MNKRRLYITFILIIILAAGAVYLDIPKGSKIDLRAIKINYNQPFRLKLGLDLQGGTHLVYEGDLNGEQNAYVVTYFVGLNATSTLES